MADNVSITQGSGTSVATDDIGGVHYQRVKLALGADGTANDASAGAGAVGTGTQRVTLASDDPAVAALAALSKSEDAAHSSADKGIMALAVRSDTAAATAGTTGEYLPLITDSTGKLWVNLTELATLTGAQSASAWTTGDGTLISLLKAIAGAAISTTPAEVRVTAAEFETVAASQTDQMLGATGGAGDTISGLLVIPATTSPGAISIEYGSTNIPVFTGGTDSVSNLIPFFIPLENIAAPSGGWEITTGANVSVIAFGNFT